MISGTDFVKKSVPHLFFRVYLKCYCNPERSTL